MRITRVVVLPVKRWNEAPRSITLQLTLREAEALLEDEEFAGQVLAALAAAAQDPTLPRAGRPRQVAPSRPPVPQE